MAWSLRLVACGLKMKPYEVIEHTADVGIKAFGRDEKELFANAAFGMFDLIADLSRIEVREDCVVELEAADLEDLLVDWLRELLYKFHVHELLFKEFVVEDMDEGHLRGIAKGERFDPQRHILKGELKAVTYHQLKVEKHYDHWVAQVIFDT